MCYKHYHAKKALETLFDVAHKVLVMTKTVKEGVNFVHLENFMDKCWNLEKQEHDGNEAEAYACYKQNISDNVLYGWVIDHLPDGRGFAG